MCYKSSSFLLITGILFTHSYVRTTFQATILPFCCQIFVHVAKLHKFYIQLKSQNSYYTKGRSPLVVSMAHTTKCTGIIISRKCSLMGQHLVPYTAFLIHSNIPLVTSQKCRFYSGCFWEVVTDKNQTNRQAGGLF